MVNNSVQIVLKCCSLILTQLNYSLQQKFRIYPKLLIASEHVTTIPTV